MAGPHNVAAISICRVKIIVYSCPPHDRTCSTIDVCITASITQTAMAQPWGPREIGLVQRHQLRCCVWYSRDVSNNSRRSCWIMLLSPRSLIFGNPSSGVSYRESQRRVTQLSKDSVSITSNWPYIYVRQKCPLRRNYDIRASANVRNSGSYVRFSNGERNVLRQHRKICQVK